MPEPVWIGLHTFEDWLADFVSQLSSHHVDEERQRELYESQYKYGRTSMQAHATYNTGV